MEPEVSSSAVAGNVGATNVTGSAAEYSDEDRKYAQEVLALGMDIRLVDLFKTLTVANVNKTMQAFKEVVQGIVQLIQVTTGGGVDDGLAPQASSGYTMTLSPSASSPTSSTDGASVKEALMAHKSDVPVPGSVELCTLRDVINAATKDNVLRLIRDLEFAFRVFLALKTQRGWNAMPDSIRWCDDNVNEFRMRFDHYHIVATWATTWEVGEVILRYVMPDGRELTWDEVERLSRYGK